MEHEGRHGADPLVLLLPLGLLAPPLGVGHPEEEESLPLVRRPDLRRREEAFLDAVAKALKGRQDLTDEFITYMLSRIPRGRFLEVEEAASMVAWLVSRENSFTTASVFDLSGGRATY